jgi:hypothetical protein
LLRISVAYQLMQRDKISPSKEGNEEMTSWISVSSQISISNVKVKLSLYQAVKAHVVRRWGYII